MFLKKKSNASILHGSSAMFMKKESDVSIK